MSPIHLSQFYSPSRNKTPGKLFPIHLFSLDSIQYMWHKYTFVETTDFNIRIVSVAHIHTTQKRQQHQYTHREMEEQKSHLWGGERKRASTSWNKQGASVPLPLSTFPFVNHLLMVVSHTWEMKVTIHVFQLVVKYKCSTWSGSTDYCL